MLAIGHPLTHPGAFIGRDVNRVDGRAKVTGRAEYAADFPVEGLLHGAIVSATVAKGRILRIDASAALVLPGVVHVFTHENRPSLAWLDKKWRDPTAAGGSPFRPLHDAQVRFDGQPVAFVVAETPELARHAAGLIHVEYERETPETGVEKHLYRAARPRHPRPGFGPPPKPRGRAQEVWDEAEIRMEGEYYCPTEHHHPMELFATTAVVEEDGSFTIYEKTQGVGNTKQWLCNVFGLSKSKVRVVSPYVGGAFGAALRPQVQVFFATLAARELKRSVRVVQRRQQMFYSGHRPETVQRLWLSCDPEGRLTSLRHHCIAATSRFEDYMEKVVEWSGMLYRCDNVEFQYDLVPLDIYTPSDMRAPGACWGMHALECAIDELSYEVGLDPLELRLRNYTDRDQNVDKPYSSKELRRCYEMGAEAFGWSRRPREPRTQREGRVLIGWGMATGVWEAYQLPASVRGVLTLDGRLHLSSATADIGTGTYTIMTQIGADQLGLPMEAVTFKLGDTTLPAAPIEGGSWTAASVGTAVKAVCEWLRAELHGFAVKLAGPWKGTSLEDVDFQDGHLVLTREPSVRLSYPQLLRSGGVNFLEKELKALPNLIKQHPYARASHAAVFAEVRVDEDLGTIQVARLVSAVAAGRILNPKTARSQVLGSQVFGIGMALEEEGVHDPHTGRWANNSLADYHIAVHADVLSQEVIFVPEEDDIVNPLGVKGLGEIGTVGVSAAIANAVFHATGKRIRRLPITLDQLL